MDLCHAVEPAIFVRTNAAREHRWDVLNSSGGTVTEVRLGPHPGGKNVEHFGQGERVPSADAYAQRRNMEAVIIPTAVSHSGQIFCLASRI
jgi:hypothetical protein